MQEPSRYTFGMWEKTRQIGNKKTLLVFFFINIYWLMALFPARMGADAAGLFGIIKNGQSTDWWTGAFYWFVKISSLNGAFPFLTSILQLTILSSSLYYFINSLPFREKIRNRALLLFSASPIYGFFGMSIAHDLTQTAGIILLLSIELRKLTGRLDGNRSLLLLWAFILLITTHTGIVIILMAAITQLHRIKFLKLTMILLTTLSLIFISSTGLKQGLNVHGDFIPSSNVKFHSMLAGLKCIAQHPQAEISNDQWEVLLKISTKEKWKTAVSCKDYDRQIEALDLSELSYNFANLEFVKTYLSVVAKNPALFAMSHIQRGRGVLPPIVFQRPDNQVELNVDLPVGISTNTAIQDGPQLLHQSIDFPNAEASKPRIFSILEVPAQGFAFLFNQASWFWGWGGLWLTFSILIWIRIFPKVKIRRILLASYPLSIMHILLLCLLPASVPRYYMFSIFVGVIMFLCVLLEFVFQREIRRETN